MKSLFDSGGHSWFGMDFEIFVRVVNCLAVDAGQVCRQFVLLAHHLHVVPRVYSLNFNERLRGVLDGAVVVKGVLSKLGVRGGLFRKLPL